MTAHPSRPVLADRDRARLQTLACQTARSVGFEPHDQNVLLDLAAQAIARVAWRDAPVEDWHAAPDSRISDVQLMQATVNVTRHVRLLLSHGTGPSSAGGRPSATGICPVSSGRTPAGRTGGVPDRVRCRDKDAHSNPSPSARSSPATRGRAHR